MQGNPEAEQAEARKREKAERKRKQEEERKQAEEEAAAAKVCNYCPDALVCTLHCCQLLAQLSPLSIYIILQSTDNIMPISCCVLLCCRCTAPCQLVTRYTCVMSSVSAALAFIRISAQVQHFVAVRLYLQLALHECALPDALLLNLSQAKACMSIR